MRVDPEDLYWRLHSISKVLESSGVIDESEHRDAYPTILDAMNFVRERIRPTDAWAGLDPRLRRLLGLGAVVDALLQEEDLEAAAEQLAPAGGCQRDELIDAVQPPWNRLQAALA